MKLTDDIKKMAIIAEFSDGKVRQILFDSTEKGALISFISALNGGEPIKVLDKEIEGIEIGKDGDRIIIHSSKKKWIMTE